MSHVQIARWAHCQRQVAFFSIPSEPNHVRPILIDWFHKEPFSIFFLCYSQFVYFPLQLLIQASDRSDASGGQKSTARVSVNVPRDVGPPVFQRMQSRRINENAAINSTVATFRANDPDLKVMHQKISAIENTILMSNSYSISSTVIHSGDTILLQIVAFLVSINYYKLIPTYWFTSLWQG